jgi:hypothetical protein
MEEQQVAALLLEDVETHFAWIVFGVLFVACALVVIASVLAARAYAALDETRILLHGVHDAGNAKSTAGGGRVATPENINASTRRQKIRTRRGRSLP